MTTPQQPPKNITADDGFSRLKEVMAVWVPRRLYHVGQTRKGFRTLRKGR